MAAAIRCRSIDVGDSSTKKHIVGDSSEKQIVSDGGEKQAIGHSSAEKQI